MSIPGGHYLRTLRRRWGERDDVYRTLYFTPVIVCVAILGATLLTWQGSVQSLERDISLSANTRMDSLEQTIGQRLASYEQILKGGVGFFQGSDRVTHQEWNNYLEAFVLEDQRWGVEELGYAQVIKAADVPAVTDRLKQDGVADFAIRPSKPPRTEYAAAIFIKPANRESKPFYGKDLYIDEVRRTAAYRARDNDATAMSGRRTLEVAGSPKIGFLVLSPHYELGRPTSTVEQRRSELLGYVYASFSAEVFFKGTSDPEQERTLGYQINVEGDATPMYESANFATLAKTGDARKIDRTFTIYGVKWNINYVLDPARLVSSAQSNRPLSVIIAGVVAAIFATTIIVLVLRGRARELAAQKERAVELAKDELLSLASHQLRTPATGVKQYLGMVLQGFVGRVPARQRELLDRAYASNDRQLRIINEILHLAKIESGRIVLARQDVDVNELITDVVNEQQGDIDEAGHHLAVRLPRKPVIINADIHSLRMVIENVLSNAIKYTLPGGTITIRVYKKNREAYIVVKDTGVGIAPADMKKIFEQFSRLPNAMSQQVGGTGIGLYLAKHLVELHGGSVEVQSQPDAGSTFTIVLPDGKEEV
jgi:signal transduction histidine kinase